jgi:hypothetical protein
MKPAKPCIIKLLFLVRKICPMFWMICKRKNKTANANRRIDLLSGNQKENGKIAWTKSAIEIER